MRPSTPRRDPAQREAERRRRRRAGHRRLALATGLLALIILGIGLGVGLSGRGGTTTGPTGSTVAGGSSTSAGTAGPTTTAGPSGTAAGSSTTAPGGGTTTSAPGASTSLPGASTTGTSTTAANPAATTYKAVLTGAQEVPPVSTAATGTLTLTVAADLSRVDYVLEVKDIRDLTVARLHQGAAGATGDTIVTMYRGPGKPGVFSGVVTRGSFTAKALTGPLAGKGIEDFVAMLRASAVYVNVGTTAHRSGEIRGTLSLAAPPAAGGATSSTAISTGATTVPSGETGTTVTTAPLVTGEG